MCDGGAACGGDVVAHLLGACRRRVRGPGRRAAAGRAAPAAVVSARESAADGDGGRGGGGCRISREREVIRSLACEIGQQDTRRRCW